MICIIVKETKLFWQKHKKKLQNHDLFLNICSEILMLENNFKLLLKFEPQA